MKSDYYTYLRTLQRSLEKSVWNSRIWNTSPFGIAFSICKRQTFNKVITSENTSIELNHKFWTEHADLYTPK